MRGPTYILKKTHLENDEKREYKMHVQKLQNIQSQKLKGEVKRSISVDKRLLEDKQKKVVQNRLFKEEEQRREQKLENKALIAKLEQIQKGKYSIMKNIKDQTFRESVYYLSSNQNLKTGNNFNPSNSKTRLRTMTANTESSRNIGSQNTYYKNSEFNEDQNEKYPKTANFFGGNFNNFNNNTDNTHKNSSRSQSNLGDHKHGYNAASNQNQIPNQHQFSGANSNYGGTIYSQSSNNNPNSTNGFNKNKENDPQTFNKYHLQRALKTEGNAEYPENQNIYSKNDQNNSNLHRGQSNPNYYKDQNNPNLYRDLNHPNALKDQNIDERDQNNPNLYKDVNNHNLSKQQSNPHYQGDPNNPEPLRDYNNPKYYNDQSDPNFFKNNPNLLRGNDYYNINDDQMIGDDGYRNGNLDNPDRIKQLSRDGKRRRINSSINLAQLNKHVSASIERQKEQERIAFENNKIVQRMMKLPPVVPTKTNLKKEFSKQKKLMKQISKFHEFKERKVPAFGKSLLDGVPLDENNQELMDQRIHLVINVKEIAFVNFLPVSSETEKYFMEIQASIHEIRRTNPEIYSDFSKSVINEFFYLREIKQNRIIYIGLYKWTPLDNGEHFLGDFELDLTPYYLQSGVHQIHYDLRNFKQMHKLPNYMVKDMRKKGWIDIEISVKSSVKQYLMDLDIIKKDYGSQEASIAYDNQTNPTERKKNSEESLVQLINSNQNGQTEKQQKLQQLKYQMNPKQKGISSFNSQNTSFNQGNKVNGVQQKQISNQSYNSFNTINNTQQNNSKGSKRGSNSNQHKSKINLQEEYDQDNFEKEDSNSQNNNNSYLQQFSDNEDEKNKKSHTGKQNFVLKEEEIEV